MIMMMMWQLVPTSPFHSIHREAGNVPVDWHLQSPRALHRGQWPLHLLALLKSCHSPVHLDTQGVEGHQGQVQGVLSLGLFLMNVVCLQLLSNVTTTTMIFYLLNYNLFFKFLDGMFLTSLFLDSCKQFFSILIN